MKGGSISEITISGLTQVLQRRGGRSVRVKRKAPSDGDSFTVSVPDLSFSQGQRISIIGSSGCGKTTLLTVLGLAQRPSFFDHQGRFIMQIDDRVVDLQRLWKSRRGSRTISGIRRSMLGFCLQRGELIPNLTVYENVELPLRLSGKVKHSEIRDRVHHVLDQVSVSGHEPKKGRSELVDRARKLPSQLSGGQYQRVALARAMVHSPSILFVDEPTSSLDPSTARTTLDALQEISSRESIIVMITHDHSLADEYSDYQIRMHSIEKGRGEIAGFALKNSKGKWVNSDNHWNPVKR